MIIINDKEYRNLEEQVQFNNERINRFIEGDEVLGRMGIKVVGQVATEDYLPNPATYTGEFGDAYLVGDNAPYDYYIYTRPFEGQEDPQWFNLGQFPVAGPKGDPGVAGATGPAGKRGSQWFSGLGQPNTTTGYEVGDVYVNTDTYNVWHLHDVEGVKRWLLEGNIRGPQGLQGIQGPRGPQGPAGPQGQRGSQGLPGSAVNLIGTLSSIDQLPEVDAEGTSYSDAYLVGNSGNYHLWYIGGYPGQESTWEWKDAGPFNAGTAIIDNYTNKIVDTFSTSDLVIAPPTRGISNQASITNYLKPFINNYHIVPNSSVNGGSWWNFPYIDPEDGNTIPDYSWGAFHKTPALRTSTGDIVIPNQYFDDYKDKFNIAASISFVKDYVGNMSNYTVYKANTYENQVILPPMYYWPGFLYDLDENVQPDTLDAETRLTGHIMLPDAAANEMEYKWSFNIFDGEYPYLTDNPFGYIKINENEAGHLKPGYYPVISCGYSDEGFDFGDYFLNEAYYFTFASRPDQRREGELQKPKFDVWTCICPFYQSIVEDSEGYFPTGSSFEEAFNSGGGRPLVSPMN